MAFRIITKPLKRRTENIPINNELTIDEVHGNIGIQIQKDNTEGNSKEDYEYKSGSEEIKSEFQSLKIRSKIINDELKNINYGSVNNVNDEGFNLNNALNENDICGAIEYVYNKYKEYIIEDEDGNIKFNSDVTDRSNELKETFNKLYNINGDSYSHKFRQILAEIFKSNKIINDYNQEKDSEISVYTKIRKDINNVYLPQLEEYEMQISKLEAYCKTLNNLVNSNLADGGEFFNSLENIKDDISNNDYEIKKRKFAYFNTDNSSNDLMTENVIKEPFNTSNNYIIEKYNRDINSDPSFIENFLPSPLDINYDGNENSTYIDSFYEMRYESGYNYEALYSSFMKTLQFNTENRDFVCLIGNNDLGISADSKESPDNYTNKLFNSIFNSFIVHDSKYNKLAFKDNQNKQIVKNALYISHKKNLRNILLKEFYNRPDIKNLLNYKLQNDIKNVFNLENDIEDYFNEYSEFDYYVDFKNDTIINKVLYQYETDKEGRFKFLYNKLNQYHYNGYDKNDLTIKNPYYYGIIFRKYVNDYNDLLNSIFNNLAEINTPTVFDSEYYYEFSEDITEVRKIIFNFVNKKFNFILLDENNNEITEPLKMIIRNSVSTLLEKSVTRSKEFDISKLYSQNLFIEFYNKDNTKLFTINLYYDNEYTFDKALKEFFNCNNGEKPIITTTFNIVNKDISPVFYSSVKDYFKGV